MAFEQRNDSGVEIEQNIQNLLSEKTEIDSYDKYSNVDAHTAPNSSISKRRDIDDKYSKVDAHTTSNSSISMRKIRNSISRAHSIDSIRTESSINTISSENRPQIHKADLFNNPLKNPKAASGSWSNLIDDEDTWGVNPPNYPSSLRDPSWTPLQTWNPTTSSWSLSHVRNFHNHPRKPNCYTKACCIRIIAILIFLSIALSFLLVWNLHQANLYNSSLGPRGGIPSSAPGPPLPIRGIINGSHAVYFGAAIDWHIDDPQHFNLDLGVAPAIHDSVFFLDDVLRIEGNVNSSGILRPVNNMLQWTAALIRGTGAIMGMTIIPTLPLQNVSDFAYRQIANECKMINDMGVPIMLRFAPEMNGNWYPYGQDAKSYISAFQNVTKYVRSATNNTVMVWSPVAATGYPFPEGLFFPNRSQSRYTVLDTTGDGFLDSNDDPFTPYYPGDSFVDWVGMVSLYSGSPGNSQLYPIPIEYSARFKNISQQTPTTSTSSSFPTPTLTTNRTLSNFTNQIPNDSSPSLRSQLSDTRSIYNFYRDFCESKRKPLIISSTSAAYYKGNATGANEVDVKMGWFKQMINSTFFTDYPLLRGLVFCNWKVLIENTNIGLGQTLPNAMADFSLTNPEVRGPFLQLVSQHSSLNTSSGFLYFATQIVEKANLTI